MTSRGRHTLGLLLALIQLGVWAFGAPLHSLQYHSPQRYAAESPTAQRACEIPGHDPLASNTLCCHHHAVSDEPTSGSSPDRCPDDAEHCRLCLLLLQAGHLDSVAALTATVELREVVRRGAPGHPVLTLAALYESRGPPRAGA